MREDKTQAATYSQMSIFGELLLTEDLKKKPSRRKAKHKPKVEAKKVVLPHSNAKLTLYSGYLEKYLSILSVAPSIDAINIFDIFCGTGIYEDGNFGSPILAFNNVDKVNEFLNKSHNASIKKTTLYINDISSENTNKVQGYLDNFTKNNNLTINYTNLDAQVMLENIHSIVSVQNYKERNLIFLDPYGYSQIRKDILYKIMQTKRVELIIFLPASMMYRFKDIVLLDNSKKAYESLREFILDFFDENHPIRKIGNIEKMDTQIFIEHLAQAFSFNNTYYSTSFYLQRDYANYYAMFFVTNSILGLERFIDMKWQIDTSHGKGFRLGINQQSMFADLEKEFYKDMDIRVLSEITVKLLCDKENITNIDLYYTCLKSNFRPPHMTEVLKRLQKLGELEVLNVDGSKTTKGRFGVVGFVRTVSC